LRRSRLRRSRRGSRPVTSFPFTCCRRCADGLVGNLDPETITFDLVRRHVAGIVTVAEERIAAALAKLVAEERVIAEGAAATAVAGVLDGRLPLEGRQSRGDSVGLEYRSAQVARVDLGRLAAQRQKNIPVLLWERLQCIELPRIADAETRNVTSSAPAPIAVPMSNSSTR
jgi:threonine dehydratase